jgi:CheY-like chemotaxis protein
MSVEVLQAGRAGKNGAMDKQPIVMVVDDDDTIRTALRDWLEHDGYQVLQAEDGIEALYLLDNQASAVVVITDHAMPRLEGRGVIDFVTQNADLAQRTAMILITAGDRILSPSYQAELQTYGVPILRNPFELADLSQMVADATARLGKS